MVVEPLNRLHLAATSVADDLGFVALADVASALSGDTSAYRIIGGRMVQLHVHRWRLGHELYRETLDADVGLHPVLLGSDRLRDALLDLGYRRESGNRFSRELDDIPLGLERSRPLRAAIDVLIPERGEPRPKPRTIGEWTVDVAPGLTLALRRPPVDMHLEVRRLNGQRLSIHCVVPDAISALALKVGAWNARLKDTYAVDLWRCLEVLAAAGFRRDDFDDPSLRPLKRQLHETLADRRGEAVARTIGRYLDLDRTAARQLQVRLRALLQRIADDSP